MEICAIAGFYRRYACAARIIRMYMLQDYPGNSVLLLYNNGPEVYTLEDIKLPANKEIILINNNKELATGLPYKDTGTIFNDSLTFIPEDVDIVTFMDTDDAYSPQHLSELVKGYERALEQGKLGYKPKYSWFKYAGHPPELQYNTMEPSWTVNKEFLLKHGMHPLTASYHKRWIDALEKENLAFVDPEGPTTFLYYWNGDDGVYKTSSKGDGEDSFQELRKWEKDGGNNVLSPCSIEEIQKYYNIVGWGI